MSQIPRSSERSGKPVRMGQDARVAARRILARDCLDWTERRPHLAGALPAALLYRFLELGWLIRRRADRGLLVTAVGVQSLADLGRDRTPHQPSVARVS